jgi:small subunit ribosomal protein S16
MIKLRLSKGGAKNRLLYRIVAIDERRKCNGKHIEIIGFYDPKKKNGKIDKYKYQKWISFGAKASPTVKKLAEK